MITAVIGTVFIAAGAFWLSFTSLSDLARRSGLDPAQAWVWPLIVDGIIVVATVAAVALARSRVAWYPWALLVAGAAISVTANAIHAIVAEATEVPVVLAASVSAVPPLVLLSITHLTSVLMRHEVGRTAAPAAEPDVADPSGASATTESTPTTSGRSDASSLRALGWSNSAIAKHLGVHPSTVGRWFRERVVTPALENNTVMEGTRDG
ncbi:DUF2637 domain-containing protein [Agromyces sp. ZXT2-6]|uniref:DUF2637 domain-containing protein n=1 Tax=Agromyces sp. ZXT2-6 TaxID=3461153 RepID=UPI0040553381